MPLRDHFRAPVNQRRAWDGLHGQWPAMMVLQLADKLPPNYSAAPQVHLGRAVEIDVDEYEVRIYDLDRQQRLVAAIELVSPSNKDRPDTRRAFVAKCAALLHQQVSVTIVDIVTTREFNLYAELLDFLGFTDPTVSNPPSSIYAGACRGKIVRQKWVFEAWHRPLELGQPLPPLPIWLGGDVVVTLDLESSYEQTCRVLRIP